MDEFLHQDASAETKEGNSNPLTVPEQEELLECEKAIRMSREGTVEAATALLRIRDRRLYRGSFKTFKDYCRHGWQMASGYAYDLIKFALRTAPRRSLYAVRGNRRFSNRIFRHSTIFDFSQPVHFSLCEQRRFRGPSWK